MSRRGDQLRKADKRGSRRAAAQRQDQPRPGRPRKGPSRLGRLLRKMALWGGLGALLAIVALAIAVAVSLRSLPSFSQLRATQSAQTIVLRARDGTEIVEMGPSYGEWLDFGQIPDSMKNAMVAVEDRRFYAHFGIDPIRLTGAVLEGLTGERRISATSTITQQLARNLFLNNNRSLDRKLREAVLAMALEWKFSKQQILELYLNKVYFGGGAYGIDSASRNFFSHPATQLSTAEAAIIAGLVKAPSRYSPTADVDAAVARARVVLDLMQEQGYISPAQERVDIGAVRLKQQTGQNSLRYFTDWVLPQLDFILPETFEPIEVWTTIDVKLQQAASDAIRDNSPAGAQGALVSLDRDGAILAMVGGTDYVATNYNRATNSQRQPGSAWKLFVYLAALEAGYTPDDRVVDTPVTIDGWSPRNSNGKNMGETNLRTAFANSINTVAAQLGQEVGFGTVASMARRFGITSPVSTFPSMVLGSSEVRLIDITRAFAAISAKGVSVEPYGITKVTTAQGRQVYRHERARAAQLVPDYVAAGITDLLQTAVNTGTGRAAQIGRPVAGKTGTTSANKDGWFIGFSSGITTGVWMGRDDAKAVAGLQGGRAPARAFAAYMSRAVAKRPVEEFDTEVRLPEWQLEPDDEHFFGNSDDYYYIDEQGNLIEPGQSPQGQGLPFPVEGEHIPESAARRADPGQAASDEFLEQAVGPPPPPMPRTVTPADNARRER